MSRGIGVVRTVTVEVALAYVDERPTKSFTLRLPFPPQMRDDGEPLDVVVADVLRDAATEVALQLKTKGVDERQTLRQLRELLRDAEKTS